MNREDVYAGLTFEQAVREYADTVTGVCVMRLQNMSDAEDCFQNTFVKLYTKSPKFKTREHLKAWLIRVAVNECNDYMRKNRRETTLSGQEQSIQFNHSKSDMSWALSRTPPLYREVLYLYYREDYKIQEIARILGKKENTVKSLLRRGREIVKQIYGGEEN